MKRTLLTLLLIFGNAYAQDPRIDIRYTGIVFRDADGTISRNNSVTAAFRATWRCPATRLFSGPCPGWKMDHVIPLSCGGADAVWNMQWLPTPAAKDLFERRIYGGNGMSKGCP